MQCNTTLCNMFHRFHQSQNRTKKTAKPSCQNPKNIFYISPNSGYSVINDKFFLIQMKIWLRFNYICSRWKSIITNENKGQFKVCVINIFWLWRVQHIIYYCVRQIIVRKYTCVAVLSSLTNINQHKFVISITNGLQNNTKRFLIVIKRGTTFTLSLHNYVFAINGIKTMREIPLAFRWLTAQSLSIFAQN